MVAAALYFARNVWGLVKGGLSFVALWFRPGIAIRAENLFLRKQLALYQERGIKPCRASDADRFLLGRLCRFFAWRDALAIVRPETLVRWHRRGFKLLWRWRSRVGGRPRVPPEARELIRLLASENRLEKIAA